MARVKRILKWAGIVTGSLIGLLILLIVLVGVFGDSSDDQANTPTTTPASDPQAAITAAIPRPTATQQPTPTPIVITAGALERQHEANEVYWEDMYVDKHVLITGTISSITEASSQYDVKLHTGNFWVNVVCKVNRTYKSSILQLATGETITIYGLVTNDGIVDIVVKDCTVRPSDSSRAKEQNPPPVSTSVLTPPQTSTPDFLNQYQGTKKTVAALTVYIGTPTGSGSGFLYRTDDSEEFVILTNSHVIQDYSDVEICWALVQKCIYEKVKNKGSENFDVAVLEFVQFIEHGLDSETLQWFTSWFESNIARFEESGAHNWAKGDVVYASGYPGGHKVQETDIISDPVVTEGIIASDRLASYRNKAYFIEHGANIESGSSGGPLMNNAANFIGINTGTNLLTEQLELAIPMDSVIEWLETGEEPSLTQTPRR